MATTRTSNRVGVVEMIPIIAVTLALTLAAPPHTPAPTTIAVVGDSVSAFNGTSPTAHPWSIDLDSYPVAVNRSDGWAFGGSSLASMGANVHPIHSDVLVVMGGTNNVGAQTLGIASSLGTPMPQMIAQLVTLVDKAKATHVIICAVAPLTRQPLAVIAWNNEERVLASQYGWTYLDPWTGLVDANGSYLPQFTLDGIHPNDAGSLLLANRISIAVQEVYPNDNRR